MGVKVTFLKVGSCTHPEAILVKGGRWKVSQLPALATMIEHPQAGIILFDTGYSPRFFQETRAFPARFYAWITPVQLDETESLLNQLQKRGISMNDISQIIISHFHADHIGGLRDFPQTKFICFESAYRAVKSLTGVSAVMAGFLPGLLPEDFGDRAFFLPPEKSAPLPQHYYPFTQGYDLLGDSSILAVELPGHTAGQMGIFVTDEQEKTYFLIADACWLSRAYQEFLNPHPLTRLITANAAEYQQTLQKIHQLHHHSPQIKIIPSHCPEAWQQLEAL